MLLSLHSSAVHVAQQRCSVYKMCSHQLGDHNRVLCSQVMCVTGVQTIRTQIDDSLLQIVAQAAETLQRACAIAQMIADHMHVRNPVSVCLKALLHTQTSRSRKPLQQTCLELDLKCLYLM